VKYKNELNIVQQHRRDKGGCGHVFSPGDTWIIEEYLAGNLIPFALLTEARKRITELEIKMNGRREIKA
jgi:hypothetical protein